MNIIETVKNRTRVQGIDWETIEPKLGSVIETVLNMEDSGGEPEIFRLSGQLYVVDGSEESPSGRRSLCYDQLALDSRKEAKPKHSALGMATEIGIELLTEDDYFQLQTFGEYDLKTSSWLATPESIRSNGGAIFGDRRFGRTFIYHNGAESYYAARGFRGKIPL